MRRILALSVRRSEGRRPLADWQREQSWRAPGLACSVRRIEIRRETLANERGWLAAVKAWL